MNPSDAYYKTKRSLLIFAGCLLLAIFAGFKLLNGEQKISVLPFQLEKPEFLSSIFAVLVVFFLFQFSLQWAAQQSEVQINRFHRIDFFSTFVLGLASVLIYLGDVARSSNIFSKLEISIGGGAISALFAIIGTIVAIAGSTAVREIAENLGRRLKVTARDKERYIKEIIISQTWTLNFNPENPEGRKLITFASNGEVEAGRNNSEHNWRVKSGLLEILNEQGKVFSRFKYDPTKRQFEHTNDPDTLSIRNQLITPRN